MKILYTFYIKGKKGLEPFSGEWSTIEEANEGMIKKGVKFQKRLGKELVMKKVRRYYLHDHYLRLRKRY